jgi:hypothetical protein
MAYKKYTDLSSGCRRSGGGAVELVIVEGGEATPV